MKVAIIPARGGSKRIPRKNIKSFHGEPLISYSIKAAINSGCFDRIIVSTDDLDIANIAEGYGAEVPFLRPESISDDFSTTSAVIKHALQWFEVRDQRIDYVCCIYATAPFVSGKSIQDGFSLLLSKKANYVFTATSFPFPIQRAFKICSNGASEMFDPEMMNVRSQDLVEAYHDAGQFYWGKCSSFLEELPIFGCQSYPLILPRNNVQDIDTFEDWDIAEKMYEVLKK